MRADPAIYPQPEDSRESRTPNRHGGGRNPPTRPAHNNPTYVAAISSTRTRRTGRRPCRRKWVADSPPTGHDRLAPCGVGGIQRVPGDGQRQGNGLGGVNLNGADNFGASILTTLTLRHLRSSGRSTRSASLRTRLRPVSWSASGRRSGQELSFIHSYSKTRAQRSRDEPSASRAPIVGGCRRPPAVTRRPVATVLQSERRLRDDDDGQGRLLRSHHPQRENPR